MRQVGVVGGAWLKASQPINQLLGPLWLLASGCVQGSADNRFLFTTKVEYRTDARYPLSAITKRCTLHVMMRTPSIRSVLIAVCIWVINLPPVTAQGTFYARYSPTSFTAGGISPAQDGGFYGATFNSEHLVYYKVDRDGDLVWMRTASLTPTVVPAYIATLSDSSFAFLARQLGSDSTFVFKVRDHGDLQWARTLSIGSSANFQALAPTTDGGMMLTGGGCFGADMIIHLDALGHIRSQHTHSSPGSVHNFPNAMDMVHEGNDQYAYMGFAANGPGAYRPLSFWRSDSAGVVTSYREIHLPLGMALFYLGRSMVRSANGGHFISVMVNDPVPDHVVLLYLDEQDELVWAKDVAYDTELMTQRGIAATQDGGCVIIGTRQMSASPVLDLPFVLRFSAQGDLVMSKMIGDLTVAEWDSFSLTGIEPMVDGGFMTLPSRWGGSLFDLCKLDADLNGFCYDSPMDPVIVDLAPVVVPLPLLRSPLNFVEGSIAVDPMPLMPTRTDLCYYTGIAEEPAATAMMVGPDPSSDGSWFTIPLDRPERIEVVLFNALGSICAAHRFVAAPGEPMRIGTDQFEDGSYILEVRMKNTRHRARIVVQH